MRAIRFLIRKEFLQIVRDKATLAQMLMIPFIQLIVLSNAATFTVVEAHVAVVDQDRTATSRALSARLDGGGQFHVELVTPSPAEAERAMLVRRPERGDLQQIGSEALREASRAAPMHAPP